MIEHIRYK